MIFSVSTFKIATTRHQRAHIFIPFMVISINQFSIFYSLSLAIIINLCKKTIAATAMWVNAALQLSQRKHGMRIFL